MREMKTGSKVELEAVDLGDAGESYVANRVVD